MKLWLLCFPHFESFPHPLIGSSNGPPIEWTFEAMAVCECLRGSQENVGDLGVVEEAKLQKIFVQWSQKWSKQQRLNVWVDRTLWVCTIISVIVACDFFYQAFPRFSTRKKQRLLFWNSIDSRYGVTHEKTLFALKLRTCKSLSIIAYTHP